MQPSLINAKFNYLFEELRKLDRKERMEVAVSMLIGAGLGYWTFMAVSGSLLCAFFAWQIRGGSYGVRRDMLTDSLAELSLSYPEEAKDAVEREKIRKKIAKTVKGLVP